MGNPPGKASLVIMSEFGDIDIDGILVLITHPMRTDGPVRRLQSCLVAEGN
jgi:hypothetical protein